jgi:hypothetical protein
VDQTGAPKDGFVTAIKGQDGRMPAPPKGDLYVRDPIAARAKAIRDRVALYKEQKKDVPEHLQELYDQLPPEEVDTNEEVELVDAVTGEHVAEVHLDEGRPQPAGVGSNTPVYGSQVQLEPETVTLAELSASLASMPNVTPELKFNAPAPAAGGAGSLEAQIAAISRAAGEEVKIPEVDITKTVEPPKAPEPVAPRPPAAKRSPGRPRKSVQPKK